MTVYYSEYTPSSAGSGIEGRSLIDLTSTSFADLFAQAGTYSSVTVYSKGMLAYSQNSIWVYINAGSSFGNAPPTLPTISNAYWELVGTTSTNTFVWIAYANSSDGVTFTDFTVGDSGTEGVTRRWIGFASNKTTAVESTNPADYQWTRFVGADGVLGADGVSGGLTNPAIQVYAYANGNVVSYTGATGQFRIDKGALDISSSFTLSSVSNPQGLSVTYTDQTYTITNGLDVNEEVGTLTIRATGSGTYSGITLERTLSISKIKGGFEILPVLTANTDSTNFDGRVVYNKADAKLYRFTGSPGSGGGWTASVPAADIAGQLIESQIANAAIGPSKLKMGVGGNMLSGAVPGTNPNKYFKVGWNPDSVDFFNTGDGGPILSPVFGTGFPDNYSSWTTPDGGTFAVYQSNNSPNSTQGAGITDFHFMYPNDTNASNTVWFPVEESKTYEFSAYTGAHRCSVRLLVVWHDSLGGQLGDIQSLENSSIEAGGTTLDGYLRLAVRGAAPAGATKAILVARKGHTTVGQPDSWMFLNRPMWAETVANATETLPYNPPPQGLIDAEVLRSNSILTRHLQSDLIETQHLKANIITASKMVLMNKDAIDPDPNFQDKAWWGWGNDNNFQTISGAGPLQPATFTRVSGGMSTTRDYFSPYFPVEAGAHYRSKFRIYISPDAVGFISPTWHWPNQRWSRPWPENNTHAGTGMQVIECATTSIPKGQWVTYTRTDEFVTSGSGLNQIQHRMVCQLTAGYVEFAWELTRAMNAELVVDGAITANKLYAGSVTTDKIDAGAVNAAKLATTELITLSAQIKNGIINNAKIEELAVSTGKIDNLAVTTGKIGNLQVDTLKIAGNAVTIPVAAFTAATTYPNTTSWTTIQSVVIGSTGAPILVLANFYAVYYADPGVPALEYRLIRNGSQVYGPILVGQNGLPYIEAAFPIQLIDTPGVGTWTYELHFRDVNNSNIGGVSNRSIALIELKK